MLFHGRCHPGTTPHARPRGRFPTSFHGRLALARHCRSVCGPHRRSLRGRCSAQLFLKAGPAQHRSALCWFERHRRRSPALGTCRARLRAHTRVPGAALRLALLAALRVVHKLFVVEEQLLTRGEHKLSAAVDAGQNSIVKFHGRLPQRRETYRNRPRTTDSLPVRFPVFVRVAMNFEGPGREKKQRQCCYLANPEIGSTVLHHAASWSVSGEENTEIATVDSFFATSSA